MANNMASTNPGRDANHTVTPQNELAQNEWMAPRPQPIPRPTYMPITVAIGGACILWGFLTSFIVSIVGVIFFLFGIIGWSGELWHDK